MSGAAASLGGMSPRRRLAAALLAAALGVTACSGGSSSPSGASATSSPTSSTGAPSTSSAPSPTPLTSDLGRYYAQKLSWKACGDGFQCTTVTVPLDYAAPASGDITLSVIRLKARRPAQRIGSLLLNPGGPGASGVDYARAARAVTSDALRARYDIVGFDPRGVGKSTPLHCLSAAQTDALLAVDGSPDTPAEEQALATQDRLLGERCKQRAPRLMAHISTQEVARDLDVLRGVLGDQVLHYLGASYGTYIGATYANLFPKNAGRLVLDGALDPTSTIDEVNRGQALGFESNLRAFVDDCLRSAQCPLPAPRSAALARVSRLFADVDRAPLRSDDGRQVTQALAVLGVVYPLYSRQLWPELRDSLAAAMRGDGTGLLAAADAYADRDIDGRYTSNATEVSYGVNCLDQPEGAPDLARFRANAAALLTVAPHFGAYLAWGPLPCAYWPVRPTASRAPITAAGAPPILVVGTTNDPATPYAWAVSLAKQLSSGVLLTFVGDGHTAYGNGSRCIDSAVDRFLLTGTPPKPGTRCAVR